ncbi:hypothetical protein SELMODRAFT_271835 [Selaginella moellendorffii]|uniref:Pathogenesis-related protein 5 n=1 Tax=Selaginella moellendorffii TaxID=88036 RepID=D8SS08_SELML|nr:pathogenesis-related protein 5 [Selaginella moellendorffii]EFJ12946.1 hypothetical protein SELMODRAFT_271835 [Selaginella moellendorffii]|eukprot:XP_024515769.1 pathogenesis-related protein 5 [Selaginella moellendorffii]
MEVHRVRLLAVLAALLLAIEGVSCVRIRLYNECPFTVWPGWISNSGKPQLGTGGVKLDSWQSHDLNPGADWAGRFWGRRGCNFDGNGRGHCDSGDCGDKLNCGNSGGVTPATLAEFQLNGHGNQDFYDVSLVDGYNLPMRINPEWNCKSAGCHSDLNAICPNELKVWKDNWVIGCKSACEVFQTDAYCCRGAHDKPETCPPTPFSKVFKDACPQAYSYAYDDLTSTFTCGTGGGYTITFCPSGGFEFGAAGEQAAFIEKL